MKTTLSKGDLLEKVSNATPEEQQQVAVIFNGKPKRRRLGTTKDACQLLHGCCPLTLLRYERRSLLHPIRLSKRKKYFDLDEIEALANNGITVKGVQR